MSKLADFRNQYEGAYDNVPDGMLAYKLWNAKFKDRMPMGQFADAMELDNQQFQAMVEAAKQEGYTPTESSGTPADLDLGGTGLLRAAQQGLSFGGGGEVTAGVGTVIDKLRGDDRSAGRIFKDRLALEDRMREQYARTSPIASGLTEFGSAMVTPLGMAKNLKQAIGYGMALGGPSGFLSSEGDVSERLDAAASSTVLGGLLGPAFYKGGQLVGTQFGRFLEKRAQKVATEGAPSLEALKDEANAAYNEASAKGAQIDKQAFDDFVDRTIMSVTGSNKPMSPARQKLTPQTATVVGELERLKNEIADSIDFEDVLEVRDLSGIAAGNFNQPRDARGGVIVKNAIDDFLEGLSPEQLSGVDAQEISSLLKTARQAFQKFRKTEAIESIQRKAGSYAGGTESGIKNQINSILRNDKKLKGFTQKEIEVMREISNGTPLGNLLGNISAMGLSTSGGRNPFGPASGAVLGGAAGGATMGGAEGFMIGALLEMGTTSALRYLRERSMEEQVQIFRDLVATGAIDQLRTRAPEVARYLQAIAQRAGQGTIITNSDKL